MKTSYKESLYTRERRRRKKKGGGHREYERRLKKLVLKKSLVRAHVQSRPVMVRRSDENLTLILSRVSFEMMIKDAFHPHWTFLHKTFRYTTFSLNKKAITYRIHVYTMLVKRCDEFELSKRGYVWSSSSCHCRRTTWFPIESSVIKKTSYFIWRC